MPTAKNKLPTFGTNAEIDNNIVDNTSSLKDTGFQPNTTIKSAEMNTYMKMLINGMSGLIDSIYNDGVSQAEINAESSADDVKNYIVAGLNQIIKTNKVDNATHADNATKLQNARTFNISGDATGTAQSFDGTANVTIPIDVKKSAALDSTNVGDATHPVYFNNEGKPVKVNQKIANDTSGKADTAGTADEAIKLQNARTISITGDATGNASFDGSTDTTITVDVKKSAALDSTNVGSTTNPVYFDATGKPQATGSSLSKSITGNAGTATKLQTPRNIALTGDVVGNANFDGSGNIEIPTSATVANAKSMVTDTGDLLNVGGSGSPVYFLNGVPVKATSTTYSSYQASVSDNQVKFNASLDNKASLVLLQFSMSGGDTIFSKVVKINNNGTVDSTYYDMYVISTGSTSSPVIAIYEVVGGIVSEGYPIKVNCYTLNGTGGLSKSTQYKPNTMKITKLAEYQ